MIEWGRYAVIEKLRSWENMVRSIKLLHLKTGAFLFSMNCSISLDRFLMLYSQYLEEIKIENTVQLC